MKFGRQLSTHIVWRGLYLVTNFIINIFLAQLFAAKDNGAINMFINNAALLILVTGFSVESGLNYFGAAKTIPGRALLNICLVWSLIAGLISVAIIPWIDTRFSSFFSNDAVYYMLVFAYLTGYLLINNVSAMFYARQQFKPVNSILIAGNVLYLLFLMVVMWLPDPVNKVWVLQTYLLLFFLQGVCLVTVYCLKRPEQEAPAVFTFVHFRTLLRYVGFAAFINLIFFLVNRIDYWFVEKYCTPAALGNYIQASKLAQVFLILPGIAASVIFSRVAAKDNDHMGHALPVVARILLLFNCAIVLFLIITGHWLLPWLFGETFHLMHTSFLLLAPGILALSMSRLTSAYFGGSSILSINFIGNLIALVLIVTGDMLLIPYMGIRGAAIVSSVGYIAFAAYSVIQFCRRTNTPFSAFFMASRKDFNHLWQLFQIIKPER